MHFRIMVSDPWCQRNQVARLLYVLLHTCNFVSQQGCVVSCSLVVRITTHMKLVTQQGCVVSCSLVVMYYYTHETCLTTKLRCKLLVCCNVVHCCTYRLHCSCIATCTECCEK